MMKLLQILGILLVVASCGRVEEQPEGDATQLQSFHGAQDGRGRKWIAAEAKTFTRSEGDKNISLTFIDMIHVGPKDFYKKTGEAISKSYKKDANMAVMLEGVMDNRKISYQVEFDRKYLSLLPASVKDWVHLTEEDRQELVAAGFLHQVKNVQKPRLINLYSILAAVSFISTQNNDLLLPDPKLARQADIDIKDVSVGEQIFFDVLFSCMAKSMRCSSQGFSEIIMGGVDDIVLLMRNRVLMDKVEEEMAKGTTNLIVPWGEKHMEDLYKRAEDLGFSESASQSIPLATCNFARFSIALRATLYDHCK